MTYQSISLLSGSQPYLQGDSLRIVIPHEDLNNNSSYRSICPGAAITDGEGFTLKNKVYRQYQKYISLFI